MERERWNGEQRYRQAEWQYIYTCRSLMLKREPNVTCGTAIEIDADYISGYEMYYYYFEGNHFGR